MRHLGILAHSIEGASLCLRTFAQAGFGALGAHQHPDVSLDCIAMGRSMSAWDEGDMVAIRRILMRSLERLAAADADFFVCPDNTAHLALEAEGEPFPIPGMHIAHIVAERAALRGYKKIGVLGTRYLLESDLYPRALAAAGLEAVVPREGERRLINDVIFDELVNGVFTDSSRQHYVEIIRRLAEDGCDSVALVCTEIPLLIDDRVSPLPTLDSTRLLARAAHEVAVGRRSLPAWRQGSEVR